MKVKVLFAFVVFIVCSSGVLSENVEKEKNAPEIVYIHYSTPEEAEFARKQILAEYEALGKKPTILTEEELPAALENAKVENVNIKTSNETKTSQKQ